jgi:serine/threonine protein kinase
MTEPEELPPARSSFGEEARSGKVRIDRDGAPTGDASALDSGEVSGPERSVVALAPGTILGNRYLIESRLGLGGHGAVHGAIHLALDLPVAVKVLALGALSEIERQQLTQRFSREARTLARIRHRNVLAVHDTGILPDGSPFLVVELVEGEDLEQRIVRGPLSIPAVVDLGRQLFAALTALAEAGVLHRDVKPANVMLHRESDDRMHLKLIDFGIARGPDEGARLTVPGQILGTPHYMPPEQLRGELLDVRADLYAACAVLYEALTGKPPFDGPTAPIVIGQILAASLVPIQRLRPDCPRELAQLIEGGLAKKRGDRPAHPLAVVCELDTITHRLGLPTGALAWSEERRSGETSPLATEARRKTPPDGTPEPPEEEPSPLEPETEEPSTPEVPGHIQDPPPHRFPSPGGVILAGVVGLVVGLALSSSERVADASERITPAETVAAQAVPLAPREASIVIGELPPTPDVTSLLDDGLSALALGEVEAALASYRSASEADPRCPEAQRGRGLAAARAGLADESIFAFERYLSLAPDAPDADRIRVRLEGLRARRSPHAP